jgi:hypothetical protein
LQNPDLEDGFQPTDKKTRFTQRLMVKLQAKGKKDLKTIGDEKSTAL